jgi:WD40 repeat protein
LATPVSEHLKLEKVCFSPDGRLVACGGKAGIVQVRDAATGRAVGEPLQHCPEAKRRVIQSLAFSPDGKLVHDQATFFRVGRFFFAGDNWTRGSSCSQR